MDRGSQIDDVQSFIKVISKNVKPWRLLLGRDVIHFDGRRGKVFLVNPQALEIGLELTTREINSFKYQDNFTRKIYKAEKCNRIYPPIFYQEIIEIIQTEKEEIKRHKQKDGSLEQQPREQQRPPLDVGSDLQVDNVQSFVEVIGDNCNLWRLLVGRIVTHTLQRKRGRVSAWGSKTSEISVDFGFKTAQLKYKEITRYKKDIFIREFNEIFPPLALEEILKSIQIHHEAERAQSERWAKERQEVERQEAQKLEAHKREIERQEAQKLEVQKREIERQEAQRLEAERQKKEVEKREAEKQTLLKNLKEHFERDFLHAHNFYQAKCTEHISFKEYQAEKFNYVQSWVQHHLNSTADPEQAAAIGAVENHIQVVARAGSGKTSTLVNRALFLQKHCGVAPNEMLLLAFNRKAAEEIRERLTSKLEDSIPHTMTFHALAYALVHPEESILFDEPDGEQGKSLTVQENIINQYIRDKALNPVFHEEIRTLMMAHFREDWERIVLSNNNKSPKNKQMLRYIRWLPSEGLDSKDYKSFGEKVIANFLFEHDILYKYEFNFWWNGINYRPDFTVFTGDKKGVIIEYFGLAGNTEYDEMLDEKRDYWQNNPNWCLLEFFPRDFRLDGEKGFCALLKQSLEDNGIICNRLSEEEIWQRIKDNTINRFTKLVVQFIQRCRKLSLTPVELAEKIDSHEPISDVEQLFLKLANKFYQSYLKYLEATGKDDFDGLMQKAAEVVASGKNVFRRKSGTGNLKLLRYVLIDEYQDFSALFYSLIKAVREQNSQASYFCVGDDWQAINGFAGSDLRFYQNFGQFFQPSSKLNISTNYRSASLIVESGNTLMQGLGVAARVNKTQVGTVEIVDLGTFKPTPEEKEEHRGDIFTPAVLRLLNKALKEDKEVVLLSRKNSLNSLPWYVNYARIQKIPKNCNLDSFLKLLRFQLPEDLRQKV